MPGNLLDEVLACIQQAVILAEVDGRMLYASPGAQEVLGYSSEALAGANLSMFFTAEDLPFFLPNLLHLARNRHSFDGEAMLQGEGERRFFARLSLRTFVEEGRDQPFLILAIQDIDQHKRLEKAFKDHQYEDLVKVANGIAHEIRNPLMGIGGFASRMYRLGPHTDEQERYYGFIVSNLKRIEELVHQTDGLISLPLPSLSQVSLKELCEEVGRSHRHKCEERGVAFRVIAVDVTFKVDLDQIRRVLSILLANALDALPHGGEITLAVRQVGEDCEISVSDNGVGISPDDMSALFSPFFSTKADGIGIDLALIKRIIERHDGQVRVESTPGLGTTFYLRLPMERRRRIRRLSFEAHPEAAELSASLDPGGGQGS
jgi:PAS domain S-box-containing protein